MNTNCSKDQLVFSNQNRRSVIGEFDGGRLTSDGGALLMREANKLFNITSRLAECFVDYRDPKRTEHSVETLLAQRIMGLAMGYEDVNNHDTLRDDAALALACGCDDPTGEKRARKRDHGHALASPSTLNRLELGKPDKAQTDRYQRIVADPDKMDNLLLDINMEIIELSGNKPKHIVLDIDTTDTELHGEQEGRFFHGYYDCYCYLIQYVTYKNHVLNCRLRPANTDAATGSVEELSRIVKRIRSRWSDVRIIIRGDGGFCRDALMSWCEADELYYVLGLSGNQRLEENEKVKKSLQKSRGRCITTGKASRRFCEFDYQTLSSWSQKRRVVCKAEWLPGRRGKNSRFVVTNLDRKEVRAQKLYEEVYCARGEMENQIKRQQLDLFADRTSSTEMRANQLRIYLSAFAGVLLEILRLFGLKRTELSNACYKTIRTELLKIAGRITVTVRRIRIAFSSVHPMQDLFTRVLKSLRKTKTCYSLS